MKLLLVLVMAASIVTLVGCASRGPDVIIDPAYVDHAQYKQDLAECERLAEQVREKAGERAVKGAIVGGIMGAILGDKDSAKKGAGVGAVAGASRGSDETEREKLRVIKNCLHHRGYTVLN